MHRVPNTNRKKENTDRELPANHMLATIQSTNLQNAGIVECGGQPTDDVCSEHPDQSMPKPGRDNTPLLAVNETIRHNATQRTPIRPAIATVLSMGLVAPQRSALHHAGVHQRGCAATRHTEH